MMLKLNKTILATLLLMSLGVVVAKPGTADMGHDPSIAPAADMPHHSESTEHGHHAALTIPAGQPVPTVALSVTPDPVAGWNVHVQTQNWQFAPEQVNQSSMTTEGHAHLYLNGQKLTRIYSEWFYLPSLPSGQHTISVALNANGHEALMHNGQAIADAVTITVP